MAKRKFKHKSKNRAIILQKKRDSKNVHFIIGALIVVTVLVFYLLITKNFSHV